MAGIVVEHAVFDQHRRIPHPDAGPRRRIRISVERRTRPRPPDREAANHRITLETDDGHHRELEISTVQYHARRIRRVALKHQVLRSEVDRFVVGARAQRDHRTIRRGIDRRGDRREGSGHVELQRVLALIRDEVLVHVQRFTRKHVARVEPAVAVAVAAVQDLDPIDQAVSVTVVRPFDQRRRESTGLVVPPQRRLIAHPAHHPEVFGLAGGRFIRRFAVQPVGVDHRRAVRPAPAPRRFAEVRRRSVLVEPDPASEHVLPEQVRLDHRGLAVRTDRRQIATETDRERPRLRPGDPGAEHHLGVQMTLAALVGGPDDAGINLAFDTVRNPIAVAVGIDFAAATRTRIGLVRVRRTAVARVDRSIAVSVRITHVRHAVHVTVHRRAVRDLIRVLDPVLVAVNVRADRV